MSAFSEKVSPIKRIMKATAYSVAGFRAAFTYEQSFRQEVYALLVVVPLGLYLGDGAIEKLLLVGCWLLVMIVELLNSAVEAVVDRIGVEHHELSGRAKDTGSAAVMLTIFLAVATWFVVLVF